MRSNVLRVLTSAVGISAMTLACSRNAPEQPVAAQAAPPKPKLGIRPSGDETVKPDLSRVSGDLQKVYRYIDEHVDDHVERLQKWVRQPSISNSGEGIPESAEMVKATRTRPTNIT